MLPTAIDFALDRDLRARAISHVAAMRARNEVLEWSQIAPGLDVNGQRVHLASPARGIFAPRGQKLLGALSVKTTVPRQGRKSRYDDQIDRGDGLIAYKYCGDDPTHYDNRLVRACYELRLPLIYFRGVEPGRYLALECLVVADDPATLTFTLAPVVEADVARCEVLRSAALPTPPPERRYALRLATQRLHQSRFRDRVLHAYHGACSICRLRHRELLDAAHIIADREEGGEPVIPNGLALCKLHHAAFDTQLLGITPDYEVRVAPTILAERDGPLLEHGLKRINGTSLLVPRARAEQPDRDRLARRWGAVPWRG